MVGGSHFWYLHVCTYERVGCGTAGVCSIGLCVWGEVGLGVWMGVCTYAEGRVRVTLWAWARVNK